MRKPSRRFTAKASFRVFSERRFVNVNVSREIIGWLWIFSIFSSSMYTHTHTHALFVIFFKFAIFSRSLRTIWGNTVLGKLRSKFGNLHEIEADSCAHYTVSLSRRSGLRKKLGNDAAAVLRSENGFLRNWVIRKSITASSRWWDSEAGGKGILVKNRYYFGA